jgi:protein-tyrosine phosphatase
MKALERLPVVAAEPAARITLSPTLVDLHCHILPDLDDGPVNVDFSLLMARRAAESGIHIVVATPHIRDDFVVTRKAIDARVALMNDRIAAEGLPLSVLAGGEISLEKAAELPDEELAGFALGDSRWLLLESPFKAGGVEVEPTIEGVRERGFKVVLAHPERCRLFLDDFDRLSRLVDSGVLCSVTAASVAGGFGDRVRQFTLRMLRAGLVHNIATDAHDHLHRPPVLLENLAETELDIPGLARQRAWYTTTAPVAILADRPLPDRPPLPDPPPQRGWRRLLSRSAR